MWYPSSDFLEGGERGKKERENAGQGEEGKGRGSKKGKFGVKEGSQLEGDYCCCCSC